MTKPIVNETMGGYTITWEKPHLQAQVRRVRVASDGQVKGELEITHKNDTGTTYILPSTQFNFSSELIRGRFSKQLKEKINLPIEWKEVFDFLCLKIQELVRSGDNYVEVWLEDDAPPPERLLDSIIYKGVQNIIFGEKGAAKSTLAYLLAVCMALPWQDNPLDIAVPDHPTSTLVLDWETDESIFRYYLSRLKKGMDLPPCQIFYRRCSLPLREDIEAIQKYIEVTGAEVLLIDSLGAAAGGEHGELKGSEAALLFNSTLRKLKRSSLIIAQTRHGDTEGDKKKHIYGSVYFTYYARNIFELCRGQDDSEDTVHLALFHRESNLGKKLKPMGFLMKFDDENKTTSIEREPVSITEFMEKLSIQYKIIETLKRGSKNSNQLAEELSLEVKDVVRALRKCNKIQRSGDQWQLKSYYTQSELGAKV